jgi:hypothetical protein
VRTNGFAGVNRLQGGLENRMQIVSQLLSALHSIALLRGSHRHPPSYAEALEETREKAAFSLDTPLKRRHNPSH